MADIAPCTIVIVKSIERRIVVDLTVSFLDPENITKKALVAPHWSRATSGLPKGQNSLVAPFSALLHVRFRSVSLSSSLELGGWS